jgi:hypothetical protein
MSRPRPVQPRLLSLFPTVGFSFALLFWSPPLSGAEIRWTGTPVVRYATGTDVDTLVALGDPLFDGTAPGTVTLTSGGLHWSLSLTQNPRQYIEVQISAPGLKSDTKAPAGKWGSQQQTQRVQLQADFVISGVNDALGVTMTASPSGSLMTAGRLVDNVGSVDYVKAVGTLSYAETALDPLNDGSSLFASQRTWHYEQSDSGTPVNIRPDPWDDELGNKTNGTYRLILEIDLRSQAVGNDGQELATATWGQKFIYQQGFLSFVDLSAPEPSTGVLAAIGLGALAALRAAVGKHRSASHRN